jgi:hypothetical protein
LVESGVHVVNELIGLFINTYKLLGSIFK